MKEQLAILIIDKLVQSMCSYFRVSVSGSEVIPKRKSAVIIANHGSCTGYDGIVLSQKIYEITGRMPRIMVHPSWFKSKALSVLINKFNLIEAKHSKAIEVLKAGDLLIIFPEAEAGNFKPVEKSYQLQSFKKGFVYLAAEAGCPIVPTCIVGAEEANINLGKTSLLKEILNLDLPIPLNLFPLPSKWHIQFLKKENVSILKGKPKDELTQEANRIKIKMQKKIKSLVDSREYVYFPEGLTNFLEEMQNHLLSVDFSKLFH